MLEAEEPAATSDATYMGLSPTLTGGGMFEYSNSSVRGNGKENKREWKRGSKTMEEGEMRWRRKEQKEQRGRRGSEE